MSHGHVLALVLAGGEGRRLRPLTENHAKPALHFAGGYRLSDFVLANLVNSEIREIYVLLQYKPSSLIKHIQTVWQRPCRHLAHRVRPVLPETSLTPGTFAGTADAVRRNLGLIERHRPDVVAIFAADHVYRMDVRQMLRFHAERDAELTIGVNPIPRETAHRFGIVEAGPAGRIETFVEKPQRLPGTTNNGPHALASMGNYLFAPQALIRLLEAAHDDGGSDFGHHVVPRAVASTRSYAYDLAANHVPGTLHSEERSYWRDVGTLEALEAAREDLLGPAPRFRLTNPFWPLHPPKIKPQYKLASHMAIRRVTPTSIRSVRPRRGDPGPLLASRAVVRISGLPRGSGICASVREQASSFRGSRACGPFPFGPHASGPRRCYRCLSPRGIARRG